MKPKCLLINEDIEKALAVERLANDELATTSPVYLNPPFNPKVKVQGGLWASAPCTNYLGRFPMLEVREMDTGPIVLFTVEEGQVPQVHRETPSYLALVRPSPNEKLSFYWMELNCRKSMEIATGEGIPKRDRYPFQGTTLRSTIYGIVDTFEEKFGGSKACKTLLAILKAESGDEKSLRKDQLPPETHPFFDEFYAGPMWTAYLNWQVGTDEKNLTEEKKLQYRTLYETMFHPPITYPTTLRVYVHELPSKMFASFVKTARKGWSPILPFWQTVQGYVYNRSWVEPCGTIRGPEGAYINSATIKLLNWSCCNYTIHVPSHTNDYCFPIPQIWQDIYCASMEEVAKSDCPKSLKEEDALGLSVVGEIPLAVTLGSGKIELYQVRPKITKLWANAERIGYVPEVATPYGGGEATKPIRYRKALLEYLTARNLEHPVGVEIGENDE